jgi:AraC-like DNA-binding protein
MPGSTVSVFGKPDEYETALRAAGRVDLLITGCGEFRAHLTGIALDHMTLLSGKETVSRIAFIRLGSRMVRVSLPIRDGASLFWGGIAARPGEIVTHGPGHSLHERTDGPCRWRVIWLPAVELARHARAMSGAAFDIPAGACRWRPTPGALRFLTSLYDDAMRASKVHPELAAGAKAARGLEQQVIAALIECRQVKLANLGGPARLSHARIMDRFESVLRDDPGSNLSLDEISATIGIPSRTLRALCRLNLGMGPLRYIRLRRMQLAHRELQDADADVARVSDVARRHGFPALGRFAAAYREQFGELPSATLHNCARGRAERAY